MAPNHPWKDKWTIFPGKKGKAGFQGTSKTRHLLVTILQGFDLSHKKRYIKIEYDPLFSLSRFSRKRKSLVEGIKIHLVHWLNLNLRTRIFHFSLTAPTLERVWNPRISLSSLHRNILCTFILTVNEIWEKEYFIPKKKLLYGAKWFIGKPTD